MLITVSVVIDTERPDAVAVYCNGHLVWPRRDWMTAAPCRGLDASAFVPEADDETPEVVTQLCPGCPVRQACEDYGRASRSIGWWGGVALTLPTRLNPYRPKLSWPQVVEIRQRYAEDGETTKALARLYHVDHTTIGSIVSGKKRTAQHTPGHKITAEIVAEMRQRHAAGGVTVAALAREYGVSASYTSKVLHRQRWA